MDIDRAQGYGFAFQDSSERANDEVVVVVQAEHAQAVENIEAIATTPGVDGVFIGPYDLSASLGKMGQLDDPAVVKAIEHITQTCLAAGVKLGVFTTSAEAAIPYIESGFTLITAGTDTLLLGHGGRDIIHEIKGR
ncbi:MAG: HpcH/HpaI aldolase/citrate lyase family protein [Candidatus Reddybacter sp.]